MQDILNKPWLDVDTTRGGKGFQRGVRGVKAREGTRKMTCQVYKALDCEHDPEQLRMQSATVANLGEKYTQGESTRSSSKDKWGVRILERVGILSG